MNRGGKHASKYGSYQVTVTIIEAKHLPQNGNPMIIVKVGNNKKKSCVRERTDCPYYNEYFVFNFTCHLDDLLSTRITISAYLRNRLRQLKYYGGISLEVGTVWNQPNHEYYHKWAMLMNSKDSSSGPKGYVKCNITINAKGEKLKSHPETDGDEDIEGNLLLPIVDSAISTRQRARYVFSVYRADGLPTVEKTIFCMCNIRNVRPYVEISFAGMKASIIGHSHSTNSSLHFNERILFKEMFPPLSPRVRIALKIKDHGRLCCCSSGLRGNSILASHTLNLMNVSSSGEYGFLPTYGPSFIHLYGESAREKCWGCCHFGTGKCSTLRPIYWGRVLLSLKTEIYDPVGFSGMRVETEPTTPIIEKSLWNTEEYILVGIIYDACMIDRRRFKTKAISFELSLGNSGNCLYSRNQCFDINSDDHMGEAVPKHTPDFESQTLPASTDSLDGKYDFIPYGPTKPCMYVKSLWPNLEWRISNSKSLRYIVNFLENELEILETFVAIESRNAYEKYNEIIASLKSKCINYLHILDTGRYDDEGGTTKLDRHRVNLCRCKIEAILKMIKTNGSLPNNNFIKIAIIHAYKYLNNIRQLCDDPQHNLPDVFVWMIAGSKRVAYARLPASEIIYIEEDTSRGSKSGERMNLFMKSIDRDDENTKAHDYNACKLEIFLWLGNAKFINSCWSLIPSGYEIDHDSNLDTFPRFFKYVESSKFQLRAHIYQGRFDPGMDASGLMDPFVRVIFHGYTLTTEIVKQSLDPFWDQTLIFPPIYLYGNHEKIKELPPKVVIEAFDADVCDRKEFCGRCIATPTVKLVTETYSRPEFPPRLEWHKFKSQKDYSGSVLAAFELIETGEDDVVELTVNSSLGKKIYNLPDDIRPAMTSHRMEVIFWGVRDLKKINCIPVYKPRIVLECAGVHLNSEVMENAKKFPNFKESHVIVDLDMPELDIYFPSVIIKAYDSRGFGCFKYAGVCIVSTAYVFLDQLITEEEYESNIFGENDSHTFFSKKQNSAAVFSLPSEYDAEKEENKGLIEYERLAGVDPGSKIMQILDIFKKFMKKVNFFKNTEENQYGNSEDETHDWWSKYFASLEEERNLELGIVKTLLPRQKPTASFKLQPEFAGFNDQLSTFELWRGKKSGDPDHGEKNFSGIFKGHIALYRWPHVNNVRCKTITGRDAADGLCDEYPPREPVKIVVRLYVIKALNLRPSDPLSGKSDPYLRIKLGKNNVNDKKNYIPNQLNPVFGKCFEMDAQFPKDYMLTIQVWDYDATSSDDLIGETRIDIENRFYSSHRAHCGISRTYKTSGYNIWRDREKPTQILDYLCKKNNLPLPEYLETSVKIGKQEFPFLSTMELWADETDKDECMALNVLHQWQEFPICGTTLVPEHIERRPLYNVERPGLEQGKLELWLDMFKVDDLPPKPPVNITPQVPEDYELRVIIFNVEDVPLVDNQFITSEKCSDIYMKGWILYEDHQKTDVHYNSLNGEGNFNWRFIFRITYSRGEHLMIVKKKVSVIAKDETEQKLPCKFNLQVWDSDHFSPDDFLGSLTMDLSRMPKGSANSKNCTLKVVNPKSPTVNLFKVMRTKAWWPLACSNSAGKYVQAGKVEMEMILVPAVEANKHPVGRGRDAPDPLAPPKRPDTSFSWFRNPWKACCFVVCRYHRWRIVCCCSMFMLVLLVVCAVYAFPGYLVKRLLGA